MISSRLTLAGRPTVANGLPLAMQASIRSCRPTTSPVDCGPMMLLPPLKMVRSAPAFQKRVRVDSGGHSDAASTISGTPAPRAMLTRSPSGTEAGSPSRWAMHRIAAVSGPTASRSA